jgi:hypothetical protein
MSPRLHKSFWAFVSGQEFTRAGNSRTTIGGLSPASPSRDRLQSRRTHRHPNGFQPCFCIRARLSVVPKSQPGKRASAPVPFSRSAAPPDQATTREGARVHSCLNSRRTKGGLSPASRSRGRLQSRRTHRHPNGFQPLRSSKEGLCFEGAQLQLCRNARRISPALAAEGKVFIHSGFPAAVTSAVKVPPLAFVSGQDFPRAPEARCFDRASVPRFVTGPDFAACGRSRAPQIPSPPQTQEGQVHPTASRRILRARNFNLNRPSASPEIMPRTIPGKRPPARRSQRPTCPLEPHQRTDGFLKQGPPSPGPYQPPREAGCSPCASVSGRASRRATPRS